MYFEPSIRTYNWTINNQWVTLDVKPAFGSNPFWVQNFLQKITQKLGAELLTRSTTFSAPDTTRNFSERAEFRKVWRDSGYQKHREPNVQFFRGQKYPLPTSEDAG